MSFLQKKKRYKVFEANKNMADTNKRIEKSLSFIKDNLTHVDSVIDKLIECDVIPMKERDSIVCKSLERDQIQSVVDIVTRKKRGEAFLSALEETKNEHVADTIKSVKLFEEIETLDRSQTYIKARNNEDDAEKYDKVEKDLENTKEENCHLRTIQKKLRGQLEEKVSRLQELNKVAIESHNKCKQLGDQNEYLHKTLNEKEEQVQTLTYECESLKTQVDQMEQKMTKIGDKIEDIAGLSKILTDVFKEVKNHNENTTQIVRDNKQLKTEFADIKKENREIKTLVSNMCDNFKPMKSERRIRPVARWQTGYQATTKQQDTTRNRKKIDSLKRH